MREFGGCVPFVGGRREGALVSGGRVGAADRDVTVGAADRDVTVGAVDSDVTVTNEGDAVGTDEGDAVGGGGGGAPRNAVGGSDPVPGSTKVVNGSKLKFSSAYFGMLEPKNGNRRCLASLAVPDVSNMITTDTRSMTQEAPATVETAVVRYQPLPMFAA